MPNIVMYVAQLYRTTRVSVQIMILDMYVCIYSSYAQTLILVKLILVKIISFLVIAPSPELGSGRN